MKCSPHGRFSKAPQLHVVRTESSVAVFGAFAEAGPSSPAFRFGTYPGSADDYSASLSLQF